jgi:hypothetical protein
MALAPPPHPGSVFRYLKQARREYFASGTAVIITITPLVPQATTAPIPVSGTAVVDPATPKPFHVLVTITLGGQPRGTPQLVLTDPVTGAWSATFPANICTPGNVRATAAVGNSPVVQTAPVAFT